MMPLITIVTTLYNYARFLPDLAESVLAQTYENWEWIVVDDASTDNPEPIIVKYMLDRRTGSRLIKYLQQPHNLGYSAAKNRAIKASSGGYIAMIDADDMLTPDSLRLRYDALQKTKKLWCHGEVQVLRTNGYLSDESRTWKRNFRVQLEREGWDLTKRYHHRLIHAQSVMVRRELHKKLGLYDESLRFSSDNEMWRRIIKFGHIPIRVDEYVAVYRVHPDRMARSPYKKVHGAAVKKKIIRDVDRRFREGIGDELKWK